MNEPTLTDAERLTVIDALEPFADGLPFDEQECFDEVIRPPVERIVAARVAEAVDRERATWATKIEQVCGWGVGRDTGGVDRLVPASELRALLAADDTEANR